MKRLTREQIKIIAAIFIGITALICFLVFIYVPQSKKLRSLKDNLTFTESQIAEINKIMQGKELSEMVEDLNRQFIANISYLPESQEDVIASLSNKARSLKVEIKSISPQVKRPLSEKVSGYNIEELPISMTLSCSFRDLGRYLNVLRNDFPVLVRVGQIQIEGRGKDRSVLDVRLEILAYLSKAK